MKLAIVTPTGAGAVSAAFAQSLKETERAMPGGLEWIHAACTDLNFGRNALLCEARKRNPDVILWIDGDEGWNADDLAAVLAPILAAQALVTAAVVPMKKPGPPIYPSLLFRAEDIDDHGYAGPTYDSGKHLYWRARRIGTGFQAWSKAAADRIAEAGVKYPPPNASFGAAGDKLSWVFGSGVYDGEALTEDMRACELLLELGIEIWLSLDASPTHWLGTLGFGANHDIVQSRVSDHARAQALRKMR